MSTSTLSIEDRFAIQDLMSAYSWALDTGDVDALVDCFTADGKLIEQVFEDPDVWEGRDAIRKLGLHYKNVPNFPGRQHHVSQPLFEAHGDKVNVKAFVFVTECQGEPPYTVRFTGWYEDVVVRDTDGRWRYQSRIIRLWDGAVLKNFPGRGQWVPRKRPPELVIKR